MELHNLRLTGNWCLTVSLTGAGRFDEARAAWEEMVRLVAWSDQRINNGAVRYFDGHGDSARLSRDETSGIDNTRVAPVDAKGATSYWASVVANPPARVQCRSGPQDRVSSARGEWP